MINIFLTGAIKKRLFYLNDFMEKHMIFLGITPGDMSRLSLHECWAASRLVILSGLNSPATRCPDAGKPVSALSKRDS